MRALTLLRQPRMRQMLALEAAGELARAWRLVRLNEFRTFAPCLGDPLPGEHLAPVDCDASVLRDIRWAVTSVNRTFGGRFTCLMQGMAGKAMLSRRGVANTLVLGAKLGGAAPQPSTEGMAAHAWLRVGTIVLLGNEARGGFVPIMSYHTDPVGPD
jgi:hypothetical protein